MSTTSPVRRLSLSELVTAPDGFNGVAHHLAQNIDFAIGAAEPDRAPLRRPPAEGCCEALSS